MVKHIIRTVVCALLSVLVLSASALAERPMVVDEAGLFSASRVAEMEKIITRIRDRYQVDVVVLTTRDTPHTSSDSVLRDWADRYFEDHGYGLGGDRSGVLYMIDMNNRYNYVSTAGIMIDYLSDRRIDSLLDATGDYLSDHDYGGAGVAFLNKLERYMKEGIEEGNFRFDEVTGKRLTGLYNKLTGSEMLLALIAGVAVAIVIMLGVKGTYSLAGSTYKYDVHANSEAKLSRDDEQFIRQQVTRIPKNTGTGGGGGGGSHGGSGVHVSSGGMSHGGGGRHF